MFKVFLCFGRLLLKCWKSCNFHAFPIAAKHHFYDFIALRGPNPVSFVHCQGFLRNLSMSLHTNRWHMAYFLCNFQGFPLLWAASAKLLKKLQFPSFQWVSLPFSNLSFALGRSIRDNCWKSCNFHAFPTAAKHHFYDPSFFRPLPRFPAEFEHVTTYKQMAYGLFSLQFSKFSFALGGFCQIVEKVAVSILSLGFFAVFKFVLCFGTLHPGQLLKKLQFPSFSHCSKASFLWLHCAKGTKPSFFRPLPRFPAEFERVTTYKQMAYGLFSLQFSRFSFALGGFCHFLPFNGFLCNFPSFPLLWAASAKNAEKLYCPGFLRILSMSLIKADGTKFIFPANFIFSFALDGFCQTAEKVAVSILSMGFFAIFLFLLCVGALHLGQLLKKLQFPCFSHCSKASFLWFHCAKGTKPSFFRPLPRFPAEFERVTTYKQMAYGLFSLQFSRFSFALGGFCHFLPFNGFLCNFPSFPLLLAASAKNAEKNCAFQVSFGFWACH